MAKLIFSRQLAKNGVKVGTLRQPYSGHLIFDHLPKTAGQAVNSWLKSVLGDGTVSPNLVGAHGELVRAAGEYPIVSGHIFFGDCEGLDPRFQYATLMREPVDRTLRGCTLSPGTTSRSHSLSFTDHASLIWKSEGDEFPSVLKPHLFSPMVAHFAAILGASDQNGSELVETAFRAIVEYDCVGIYERLNDFVADLARLIGIPPPASLQTVNPTNFRPRMEDVSAKLLSNIRAITEFDRILYSRVVSLVEGRLAKKHSKPPTQSGWARYERPETDATHEILR